VTKKKKIKAEMVTNIKFKDFEFDDGNHFIAMEYYGIILNRTFLILITENDLIGIKVNGLISVEGGGDPLTRLITSNMAVQNDLDNPYSYIKSKYLRKIENLNIYGKEILNVEKANFKINRHEIKSVTYDKRKKWGMGYYPHDGKVYVKTENERKKEFIILGSQSGEQIKEWIEKNKTEHPT
jgi:hypothetical protein